MQKKIIALAVAGLVSGVAFAQSNVTVYGVVDAGYANISSTNNAATGVSKFSGIKAGNDAGSRIGFKGEEALGNGLKAIFNLEFGSLNVDQTTLAANPLVLGSNTNPSGFGSGMGQTRNSVVGLSSNTMGTIQVGRQQSPSELWAGATRPMGAHSDAQGIGNATLGMSIQAYNDRIDNSIQYISPTFSGFTGKLMYAFTNEYQSQDNTTHQKSGMFWAHLEYANGPINVAGIYRGVEQNDQTSPAAVSKKNEWGIRGAYDFKVARVGLSYNQQNVSAADTNALRDGNVWVGFVTAPVGANGLVMAEYGRAKSKTGDDGGHGWALGYKHSMSKRTDLYTWYGEMAANSTDGFTNNGTVNVGADGKSKGLVAGIKHSF
jgi:predicted porin